MAKLFSLLVLLVGIFFGLFYYHGVFPGALRQGEGHVLVIGASSGLGKATAIGLKKVIFVFLFSFLFFPLFFFSARLRCPGNRAFS
jgi:hypothetical protein